MGVGGGGLLFGCVKRVICGGPHPSNWRIHVFGVQRNLVHVKWRQATQTAKTQELVPYIVPLLKMTFILFILLLFLTTSQHFTFFNVNVV